MTFRAEFEHRTELLTAALDEFCERGYDAASINRILAASGMSKGQLYHHFSSKEGLYVALVEWMIDEKVRWFALNQPKDAGGDFLSTLRVYLRASLSFASAQPDVDRLSRALLGERGRPIFDVVVQRFSFDPESAVAALVAHHHKLGAFREAVSLEFAMRVVLLVVNHAPDLLDLRAPEDLGRQLEDLLGLIGEGIVRR